MNKMNKSNKSRWGLIFATVGLITSCINLILSKGQDTSVVLFCSLITIWLVSLERYKTDSKHKDE